MTKSSYKIKIEYCVFIKEGIALQWWIFFNWGKQIVFKPMFINTFLIYFPNKFLKCTLF